MVFRTVCGDLKTKNTHPQIFFLLCVRSGCCVTHECHCKYLCNKNYVFFLFLTGVGGSKALKSSRFVL